MYNENKTIDEIQNKLKLLDNEQIQKAINKHKNKNKNKNTNVNNKNTNNDLLSLIKKINSTLNILVELELKRSKLQKSEFDILVENDIINKTKTNNTSKYNKNNIKSESEEYTDDETLSENEENDNDKSIIKSKLKKYDNNDLNPDKLSVHQKKIKNKA